MRAFFKIAVATLLVTGTPVRASDVDTLLLLAVNVSGSVNDHRWQVQKSGYAAAFRDERILKALRERRTAVTLFQWAGNKHQEQSVPWMELRSDADAHSLTEQILQVQRRAGEGTAIGSALLYAKNLIDTSAFTARRHIVDISGDGIDFDPDEYGFTPVSLFEARKLLVESNIVINGLPIVIPPAEFNLLNIGIEAFYQENVIGGPGCFAISVQDGNDTEAFRRALIWKLLRELVAHKQ